MVLFLPSPKGSDYGSLPPHLTTVSLKLTFLEVLKIIFWKFHTCIHCVLIVSTSYFMFPNLQIPWTTTVCPYANFIIMMLLLYYWFSSSLHPPSSISHSLSVGLLFCFWARDSSCRPDWPETMDCAGFRLMVLFLSQHPECWDYGHGPPYLVLHTHFLIWHKVHNTQTCIYAETKVLWACPWHEIFGRQSWEWARRCLFSALWGRMVGLSLTEVHNLWQAANHQEHGMGLLMLTSGEIHSNKWTWRTERRWGPAIY